MYIIDVSIRNNSDEDEGDGDIRGGVLFVGQ